MYFERDVEKKIIPSWSLTAVFQLIYCLDISL